MTRGLKPTTITPGTSPVVTVPPPPSYLSKDARAEWRRVAPILIIERKVMTIADMGALENYCIALGTMRELHRLLQIEGHVHSKSGKRHPASTALIQAQQMQLRAAGELGLTPSARSRTAICDAAGDDEDFL